MTTTPTSDTAPDQDDHGFELKRNSKWVWIAFALAIVIVGAVIVRYAFFNETKSANEIPGATLVVATIHADGGPTAKRIRPRAQGRAFRIRKRTSHITVIVESRPPKQKGAAASSARSRRAQGSKAASTKTKASAEAKEGSE